MDFAPVQAVVFDLDDTLFDTSGQLVGPANVEAAAAMIAAGLEGTVEAVAERRRLLARAHPTECADTLTARSFGREGDGAVIRAGREAYFRRRVNRIEPFEHTHPVLQALAGKVRLFLMTLGDPRTQRRKVELLELEPYFEAMVFVDLFAGETKVVALAELLAAFELPPQATVVVGDRLDAEIEAGRASGTWTVRYLHGEGRHRSPDGPAQQPHYTIEDLRGLEHVLRDIADELRDA